MSQKMKIMILKSKIIKSIKTYKMKFLILTQKYKKCICNKTSIAQKVSENKVNPTEIPALITTIYILFAISIYETHT